jgi:hypothetical protein
MVQNAQSQNHLPAKVKKNNFALNKPKSRSFMENSIHSSDNEMKKQPPNAGRAQ